MGPSLKGFELWAPILQVVCNGAIMGSEGFGTRAHTILYYTLLYFTILY